MTKYIYAIVIGSGLAITGIVAEMDTFNKLKFLIILICGHYISKLIRSTKLTLKDFETIEKKLK